MPRNRTVYVYKWKCELCGQESKKWLPRWKVTRSYKMHFNRYHNGIHIQPILTKKYIGGGGNENKKSKKIRKRNRSY